MGNYYIIISVAAAWFMAQFLKAFTGVFKLKKFSVLELLFGTGGMPSSHSASVSALAAACFIREGFGSPAFGISVVLAFIVMRDAMGMRRQVGEHAKVLNRLFKNLSDSLNDPTLTEKALEELAGHTPLQVAAGLLLGVAVPVGFMFIPAFETGIHAPQVAEVAGEAAAVIGSVISAII